MHLAGPLLRASRRLWSPHVPTRRGSAPEFTHVGVGRAQFVPRHADGSWLLWFVLHQRQEAESESRAVTVHCDTTSQVTPHHLCRIFYSESIKLEDSGLRGTPVPGGRVTGGRLGSRLHARLGLSRGSGARVACPSRAPRLALACVVLSLSFFSPLSFIERFLFLFSGSLNFFPQPPICH